MSDNVTACEKGGTACRWDFHTVQLHVSTSQTLQQKYNMAKEQRFLASILGQWKLIEFFGPSLLMLMVQKSMRNSLIKSYCLKVELLHKVLGPWN